MYEVTIQGATPVVAVVEMNQADGPTIARYAMGQVGVVVAWSQRSTPAEVIIRVLYAEGGELKTRPYWRGAVQCPVGRMTEAEYVDVSSEALQRLPVELRQAVGHFAYEMGHASGFEATWEILDDLVGALAGPVESLQSRLLSGARSG
jgi:hypothetical protein